MGDVTLLELRFTGDFVANAPFGRMSTDGDDGETATTGPPSGGRPWLAAAVGLLFLLVLGVLAKRKLDESSDARV